MAESERVLANLMFQLAPTNQVSFRLIVCAHAGKKAGGRAVYTHSSADISRGLMYSNPSNSDWSIFLTASLREIREIINQS